MTHRRHSKKVFLCSKHADHAVSGFDQYNTSNSIGEGSEMHIDPPANKTGNGKRLRHQGEDGRGHFGGMLEVKDSLSGSPAHSDAYNDDEDEDDEDEDDENMYGKKRARSVELFYDEEKLLDSDEDISEVNEESEDSEVEEESEDSEGDDDEEYAGDDDESEEATEDDESDESDSDEADSSFGGNPATPEINSLRQRSRSSPSDNAPHRNNRVDYTVTPSPAEPPPLLQHSPTIPYPPPHPPPQSPTPTTLPPVPPSPSPMPLEHPMSVHSPTQPVADTSMNDALSGLLYNPLDDPLVQSKVGTTTVNRSRLDFDAIPPQGLSSRDLAIPVPTDEVEEIPRSPPPEAIEPQTIWFKRRDLYVTLSIIITNIVL
jgi:hypothetical protein